MGTDGQGMLGEMVIGAEARDESTLGKLCSTWFGPESIDLVQVEYLRLAALGLGRRLASLMRARHRIGRRHRRVAGVASSLASSGLRALTPARLASACGAAVVLGFEQSRRASPACLARLDGPFAAQMAW